MSKILRRPMFRGGGKVSSYGNGIASGLADGGMPLLVGQHPNSAKGPDGREMHKEVLPNLDIFNQTYQDKDYRLKQDYYKNYKPPVQQYSDIEELYQKSLEDERANIDAMEIEQVFPDAGTRYDDLYDLSRKGGKTEFFQTERNKQKEIIDDAAKYDVTINTILENQLKSNKKDTPAVRTEAEIEADLLKKLQGTKLTDEEKLAEVEKDQVFFEKLLGGGKAAKIQDASDMAISFASKALGEGATVKSAFADFLADETKRPSRRMKVKDAATQAAIQSYLTGKTSYQKFQDQIALTQAGIDMKLDAAKPKNLSQAFTKYLKTNDKATDPGIMSQSVEEIYGEGSFGGELKPDVELIVGKVYYGDAKDKSSNKILYLIDKNGEPQFLKTVYR